MLSLKAIIIKVLPMIDMPFSEKYTYNYHQQEIVILSFLKYNDIVVCCAKAHRHSGPKYIETLASIIWVGKYVFKEKCFDNNLKNISCPQEDFDDLDLKWCILNIRRL